MPAFLHPGTLARFLVLSGASGISIGVLAVAVPLYALGLPASAAEVGLIRAAGGLGLLLAAIPAGFCVDRFGPHRSFHAGSIVSIASIVGFAFAPTPAALALLVFCDGAARALQLNALGAIYFEALPWLGPRRLGWHKASLSTGLSFAGPLLAGLLLGSVGFGVTFATVVALVLLPNLLIRRIAAPRPSQGHGGPGTTLRDHLDGSRALLQHPRVVSSLLTEAVVSGSFAAFTSFMVVRAVTELGQGAGITALLVGLEGAAFIVTVFRGGERVARRTHRAAALGGIALSAVSFVGLALATSLVLLAEFAVTLGVGLGVLNLVTTARAASLPGEKGRVTALFMTAASLGGALGPAFAGVLAGTLDTRAAFIGFVPLYLLLAVLVLAPARPRPLAGGFTPLRDDAPAPSELRTETP
ncbi:MFS transporter [Rhodovastum atsumiense]|nr:MFS transporter [Rhodovastum atsumiense]CAH2601292.1 MFS transporter [Rhodovastum atsumiense]